MEFRDNLYINGMPAKATWGVYLENGGLSTLMTPPPMKDYITNTSPVKHGVSVANLPSAMPMVKDRDIQLTFCLSASSTDEFMARYDSFMAELRKGMIEIRTIHQPNVVYRCLYTSCQQFTQYNGTLAKFSLKMNEPNPMDRDDND